MIVIDILNFEVMVIASSFNLNIVSTMPAVKLKKVDPKTFTSFNQDSLVVRFSTVATVIREG